MLRILAITVLIIIQGAAISARITTEIAMKNMSHILKSNSTEACSITQYLLALEYDCGFESIHGLWPDPEETCTYCTDEEFDESQLSESTLTQMEEYWPSCVEGNTNEGFWSHEWEKHGTCTGMTQEEYFSETLSLFDTYKSECSSNCYLCFTPELSYEGQC